MFRPNLSIISLLFANLIPLVGALFFDWNAILILALFWVENLIIGGFNIIKLLSIGVYKKQLKALFIAAFFTFHYGAFCSVHGAILWNILDLGDLDYAAYLSFEWMGVGELFSEGIVVLLAFIDKFSPQIWLGIAALLMSHCVLFIENFILRGGIFKQSAKGLMAKPYAQIFILHAGLIFGAVGVEKYGSPLWLLLVIIVFKIVVDVVQHQRRVQKEATLTNVKLT